MGKGNSLKNRVFLQIFSIYCGFWVDGLIDSFFFKDAFGRGVTIESDINDWENKSTCRS